MKKLETFLLPILCFFLITINSVSGVTCFNEYFKPNSTFDLNRRSILSSLASNVTSHNGFFNSSIGQDPNRIFIIAMCIPGTKPETCSDCIEDASNGLLQTCLDEREAYTWPDCCMVRYSNVSFSGSLVMEPSEILFNTGDIEDTDANLTVFDRTWEELMVRTITAASLSSNESSSFGQKYFAAEVASLTPLLTMYAMMQCTPDVSSRDCEFCLKISVDEYESCCRGKQGGAVVRPSCFVRSDLYPYAGAFKNITLQTQPPISSTPPVVHWETTTDQDRKSISRRTIVAIVVPIIVVVILLVVGFAVSKRRKSYKTTEVQAGNEITITDSLQFSFKTIEAATNKFSDSNLIGRGGFGEVYRGTLLTGTEVAVKRLSKTSGQGAREFKNEAVLVAKLQHKNLVRLLGFCLEEEEQIVVYEFVHNRSLDYFLFDPAKQGELDWTRRYNIIEGIARGILYLHKDSRLTIIHRDLKASNILLDADMNPKIADFGMARIFGVDQSQADTRRVVGTYGYMSPEYAMHGHFSMKSDIYSFGILVLEIISGKKNSSFYHFDDSGGNMVTHAWNLWRNGLPLDFVDPTIGEINQRNEATRCIHIALLCVQENPADRPMLPAIIMMLTSSIATLPEPRAPGFCLSSSRNCFSQPTSRSIHGSINDLSITDLDPR